MKNSFNSYPLDRLALAGAVASLHDEAYFQQTRQAVIASREQLTADLEALGFEVLPSVANFVFARHPQHDAAPLAAGLRARSVMCAISMRRASASICASASATWASARLDGGLARDIVVMAGLVRLPAAVPGISLLTAGWPGGGAP